MQTIYRICSEDVLSFVKNKENGEQVLKAVYSAFTCMEELGYFIEETESIINRDKRDKYSLIEIKLNKLATVDNYQEDVYKLSSGHMLLVLETDYHLFYLFVEENWSGKFLTYELYRKDYYCLEEYRLFNIVSETLSDYIERVTDFEYSLQYFIRFFAEFLANGSEHIELTKDDDSAVLVDRYQFEKYLEEEDDVNPDYPKTVKEFMKSYTYDDVQEFLDTLGRRGYSYFLYRYF